MILDFETNLIIGVSKGQEENAGELLRLPRTEVTVVLPGVAVMEAWSWFEEQQRRRRGFEPHLTPLITDLRRDRTSPSARSLLRHLEQALIDHDQFFNDVAQRLTGILGQLAGTDPGVPPVEIAPLTVTAMRQSLVVPPQLQDPTDNLILATMLDHAAARPGEEKALLTNDAAFHEAPVQALLAPLGFVRFFRSTDAFLGWFRSLPPPP